ncbi:MAG: hypothetical protein L0Z55_02865 [Planctomycetes bacterium]|nr:hypothetical protein [Planctomycetota bacterium]
MTTIPYWPHIWAIPLTLAAGAVLGSYLRGVLAGAPFTHDRREAGDQD